MFGTRYANIRLLVARSSQQQINLGGQKTDMLNNKTTAKKRAKHEARRKKLAALHIAEDRRLARGDLSIVGQRHKRKLKDNREHHRARDLTTAGD